MHRELREIQQSYGWKIVDGYRQWIARHPRWTFHYTPTSASWLNAVERFFAEAFGVREDTVRLWRGDFGKGGVEALKASVAPGPAPVKSGAALRIVTPLLEEPVADRPNWTIARLRAEIETREGVSISRSQLSKALRKKSSAGGGPGTR